jgi:hypothetical protein
MLLIECALILEQVKIPVWLLSHNSSFDVVSLLHRLYPAFMNGCRCIVGAFVIDHKSRRIEALQELNDSVKSVTLKTTSIIQRTEAITKAAFNNEITDDRNNRKGTDSVTMASALRGIQRNSVYDSIVKAVNRRTTVIQDPILLRRQEKSGWADYDWLRNIVLYLIARFILIKSKTSKT